ncbi:hypothetical protein ANO11243_059070 [Dothideomycetidae sp. 11243]|nr:hypothetical protein ANO11243_059070 [fungal sp. No.11243]
MVQRASSGEKLGTSIASDFWKKAAQAVKVTKAPSKPIRAGSKAVFTKSNISPTTKSNTQTRLDIKIPDKALTDAGFTPIAKALVAALEARCDLVLTELNLSGNELTHRSLNGLIHIVRHSPALVSLDLSDNRVSIKTREAIDTWREFIHACCVCPSMAKLSFDDNPEIGALAFECLTRVTAAGFPDASNRRDSHQGTLSDGKKKSENGHHGVSVENLGRQHHGSTVLETTDSSHMTNSLLPDANVMATNQPRIFTAQRVGLDEHAALFISAMMLRKAYGVASFKIDWRANNDSLGKDGVHLLEQAGKIQSIREQSEANHILEQAFAEVSDNEECEVGRA